MAYHNTYVEINDAISRLIRKLIDRSGEYFVFRYMTYPIKITSLVTNVYNCEECNMEYSVITFSGTELIEGWIVNTYTLYTCTIDNKKISCWCPHNIKTKDINFYCHFSFNDGRKRIALIRNTEIEKL